MPAMLERRRLEQARKKPTSASGATSVQVLSKWNVPGTRPPHNTFRNCHAGRPRHCRCLLYDAPRNRIAVALGTAAGRTRPTLIQQEQVPLIQSIPLNTVSAGNTYISW
uniref:(northern house mosquito) hypothetical protein n=1 Tax=Culex pipiens TaxID=7175 RepID=A0A8D8CIE9_CULPI